MSTSVWPSESVLVYRDAYSRLMCCKGGSESEAEWDGSHRLLTFGVSSKFPSGSRGSHEVRPGCLLLTPPAQQIKYSLFSYTFFSHQLHLFCPHASPPGKSQVWELWTCISGPGQPVTWRKSMCTSRVEISCCCLWRQLCGSELQLKSMTVEDQCCKLVLFYPMHLFFSWQCNVSVSRL